MGGQIFADAAVDVAGLVGTWVGTIVSLIALALAVYFYNQSRNTETLVRESLAGIRAQTDALQKLTARWMDRFTRYATEANPSQEIVQHLIAIIRDPVRLDLGRTPARPEPEVPESILMEVVSGYIAIYYYCCLLNLFAQFHMPTADSYDPANSFHQFIAQQLNGSASDAAHVRSLIEKVDRRFIDQNPLKRLFDEAEGMLTSVKNSTDALAEKTKGGG